MRAAAVFGVLAIAGCAQISPAIGDRQSTRGVQVTTPTQRVGAALAAADECGGELTPSMSSVVALAVEQEGGGAVRAAEYTYRALWTEAELSPVERDLFCANAFKNGWIQ